MAAASVAPKVMPSTAFTAPVWIRIVDTMEQNTMCHVVSVMGYGKSAYASTYLQSKRHPVDPQQSDVAGRAALLLSISVFL